MLMSCTEHKTNNLLLKIPIISFNRNTTKPNTLALVHVSLMKNIQYLHNGFFFHEKTENFQVMLSYYQQFSSMPEPYEI